MKRLFLGGEASGKSALALAALRALPGPGLMLATGRALDFGFREQILTHQRLRPVDVAVIETGLDLPEALASAAAQGRAVLADSLDFWLFAAMEAGRAPERRAALLDVLDDIAAGHVLLVSCEAGLGPLAVDPGARSFVRALGALNQAVAARCHEVVLAVAGRALILPPGAP